MKEGDIITILSINYFSFILSSDTQSELAMEADGSLFIDTLSDAQLPINYTCTVYNTLGSDLVVYHLYKEKREQTTNFAFLLIFARINFLLN